MTLIELKSTISDIVKEACALKDKHTSELAAPANYACMFSQSDSEYSELKKLARQLGKVLKETPTGPLFLIDPLDTVSGKLKLLKIRKHDPTRPERGDADFTINNYKRFKDKYLPLNNFKLIKREKFEMIEKYEQYLIPIL